MSSTGSNHKHAKVSIFVKLFVLFHIVAIVSWTMPDPPDTIDQGKVAPAGSEWIPFWNKKYLKQFPPLSLYLCATGFWQYWDMFSPDPARSDTWGDAQVVYRDGSVKHYQYPRMALLPLVEKYQKERFRKYFERAGSDKSKLLWPVFAFRIAFLNDDPKNPPVEVKLYRHWKTIHPPGEKQETEYSSFMFYDYAVDQKQLAAAREHPL